MFTLRILKKLKSKTEVFLLKIIDLNLLTTIITILIVNYKKIKWLKIIQKIKKIFKKMK